MRKRKPPVPVPDIRPLTFRGLDLCDGCGARLDPGDQLAGLCPACVEADQENLRALRRLAADPELDRKLEALAREDPALTRALLEIARAEVTGL